MKIKDIVRNFVLVLIFVGVIVGYAKGDIIHCEFTGEIEWLNINNNPHSFYLGQTYTGWFTYNSDIEDSNPDPDVGRYEMTNPGEVYLIIQGIRYGTSPGNPEFNMGTYNDREVLGGFNDQVWFQAATVNNLYINFVDNQAKALNDDKLPLVEPWLMPILGNNGSLSIYNENGQIASSLSHIVSAVSIPSYQKVKIDIKPGSYPNSVNVKSKGVLPVAILGTEDFEVFTIDPASIRLAGVAPLRSSYKDITSPSSEGPDGYLDLTLKFDTQDILEVLAEEFEELNDGDELELTLTGMLDDNTQIEGKDCVVIISKEKQDKKKEDE